MTSSARREPEPHPLARTSPATIRQWLLPDDADRFVSDHENALDTARTALDLTDVQEVVERWRAIAILQTDPDAYQRTMRRAAELATGEPSPADEPLGVTTPPPASTGEGRSRVSARFAANARIAATTFLRG